MRHAACRVVAGVFPVEVIARSYVSEYPVVVAAFGEIDHVGENFVFRLYGFPEQLEYAGGHIWVSD